MARKAQLIVRNLDPAIVAVLTTSASFKEWLERMPDVGTDRAVARKRLADFLVKGASQLP